MSNIVKFNTKQLDALELFSKNPHITYDEVAEVVDVHVRTINNWMADPNFLDAFYKRYMEVSGKELPMVIKAMIEEAKCGNVYAGRLVLEHFGKLEKKVRVTVESPFEKFLKLDNIEDAEFTVPDAKEVGSIADTVSDINVNLPERDKRNDNPRKRMDNEKVKLSNYTRHSMKKESVAKQQNSAYQIRKRAKKVGLDLLPPGRHSKKVRLDWLKKLEKLEEKT